MNSDSSGHSKAPELSQLSPTDPPHRTPNETLATDATGPHSAQVTRTRWQRYVDFWNESESPHALALCRITFGLALVSNAVEQLLHSSALELYAEPSQGGIFAGVAQTSYSLFRLIPSTPEVIYACLIAYLLSSILFMTGLFTRPSAFLCLILQMSLNDRIWMYRFDADIVFQVYCYLFVLAPAGACMSLDAHWRGKARAQIPAWPRRLLIAQLTFIYVRTGIVKMGSTWSFSDGYSALYYALNLPGLARWSGDWVVPFYPLSQLATFVAKWWEITFFMVPLSLFLQRGRSRESSEAGLPFKASKTRRFLAWDGWRWGYLAVGAIMHASLVVVMNLGLFPFVMVSVYPSCFKPAETELLLNRFQHFVNTRLGWNQKKGVNPGT